MKRVFVLYKESEVHGVYENLEDAVLCLAQALGHRLLLPAYKEKLMREWDKMYRGGWHITGKFI